MKKNICGIETEIIIKNVKNVSIKIKNNGDVVLTVPKNKSEKKAEEFFVSKLDWIKKNKQKIDENLPSPVADGERIFFFGKPITLTIADNTDNRTLKRPFVRLSDNELIVIANDKKTPQNAIEDFLTRELKNKTDVLFKKWTEITGLYPSSVKIRKMDTKWGSCTPETKRIRMSFYLVGLPLECVEYVTLHEILHIRYPDHGTGFHAALDEYMPNWKTIRKFMRENGGKYKINL